MSAKPARSVNVISVVAGLEPEQGGLAYSVPRLCDAVSDAGAQVTVMSVARPGVNDCHNSPTLWTDRRFTWNYYNIPVMKEFRSSHSLYNGLLDAGRSADVIHSHGLWLMPHLAAARVALRLNLPHVIAPRGMLGPAALTFSKYKKKAYWHLLQKRYVQNAICLHATSDQEYQELRNLGLTNPIAVIPNGIDVPDPSFMRETVSEQRVVLSMGRLHPKKGLDRLLEAWSSLEGRFPNWQLAIVGPDENGYATQLSKVVQHLQLKRVSIRSAVYGEAKFQLMQSADLFVLPTLNENFGLVVAEALASEIPAISTTGAPWSGLLSNRCGWWIDHGFKPLSSALADAMSRPREELRQMGQRGREWVQREFSWSRVGHDMLEVYQWTLHRSVTPLTLRLN